MTASQKPQSGTEDQRQVDPLRRRFAKGGLGVPVVVGSLLSRPVLGQTPYSCTISGQMSGNTSSHGEPVVCADLGLSPSQWLKSTQTDWPGGYVPGVGTIDFFSGQPIAVPGGAGQQLRQRNSAVNEGTLFGAPGFHTVFKIVADPLTGKYRLTTSQGDGNATMLQVLAYQGSDPLIALGRAAVASLLSAMQYGSGFPLTPAQVVGMFNAVCLGGAYEVTPTVSWYADDVRAYFESLYY